MQKMILLILFTLILYWISKVDRKEKKIPNQYLIIAIMIRLLYFGIYEEPTAFGLLALLVNGFLVAFPLLVITLAIERLWKKDALGGGDIKLIFVTGLYLGWEKNLWMLLIACIIGISIRLYNSSKEEFPFGPSIAVAAVICTIFDLLHSIK